MKTALSSKSGPEKICLANCNIQYRLTIDKLPNWSLNANQTSTSINRLINNSPTILQKRFMTDTFPTPEEVAEQE